MRPAVHTLLHLMMVFALFGCGGGGGSADSPGAVDNTQKISGRASVLGSGGVPANATVGTLVELKGLTSDGSVSASIVSTTVGPDGRFTLSLPPALMPGPSVVVEFLSPSGPLRGVASSNWVEISPASEALFQELSSIIRQRGSLPSESPSRFGRFVTAATQFLHLMDVHAATQADAVVELRGLLELDPASRSVFASLRAAGTIGASLPDVGGLFGLGMAAWITYDASGQKLQTALRYKPDNGGEYDVWESRPSDFYQWTESLPDLTLRLLADGAQLRIRNPDNTRLPLDRHLGPIAIMKFGVAEGSAEELARVQGKTFRESYDNDNIEDSFEFTSSLRNAGYETTNINGVSVRALRLEKTDLYMIALSGGGTLRLEQQSVSWQVPFGGALRTAAEATVTEASGRVTRATDTTTKTQAAVNGMKWPERTLVQTQTLDLPQVPFGLNLEAVAAPSADRIVFGLDATSITVPKGLWLLDVNVRAFTKTLTFPGYGEDGRVTAVTLNRPGF